MNAVGKMMAPIMPLMIDASDPLRNEAAGSMPFLLNAASDKTKQNFLDRSQKLYLQGKRQFLRNNNFQRFQVVVKTPTRQVLKIG